VYRRTGATAASEANPHAALVRGQTSRAETSRIEVVEGVIHKKEAC